MFEKILIATDLSPASDCLLQCTGELKNIGVRQIVLTHVIYVANTPGLEDALRAEAAPIVARQKQALEDVGLEVIMEMPVGKPAHSLREVAMQYDVDAILIGSRGRGIAQRAMLGGVAFKLLHISDKPVLLERGSLLGEGKACRLSLCKNMFEHILLLTDFSDVAKHAFYEFEKIVAGVKGAVTILHVQDSAPFKRATMSQWAEELKVMNQDRLNSLKERLAQKGAQIEAKLVIGIPQEAIMEEAASGKYSLIVMGTQGKGFFSEIVLGSLAHDVASKAELPVLFYPVPYDLAGPRQRFSAIAFAGSNF